MLCFDCTLATLNLEILHLSHLINNLENLSGTDFEL